MSLVSLVHGCTYLIDKGNELCNLFWGWGYFANSSDYGMSVKDIATAFTRRYSNKTYTEYLKVKNIRETYIYDTPQTFQRSRGHMAAAREIYR